jgi:hypothetical protein
VHYYCSLCLWRKPNANSGHHHPFSSGKDEKRKSRAPAGKKQTNGSQDDLAQPMARLAVSDTAAEESPSSHATASKSANGETKSTAQPDNHSHPLAKQEKGKKGRRGSDTAKGNSNGRDSNPNPAPPQSNSNAAPPKSNSNPAPPKSNSNPAPPKSKPPSQAGMSGNHTSFVRNGRVTAAIHCGIFVDCFDWRRFDEIGQGRVCAVWDFIFYKKERIQTGRLCAHGTDRH